MVSIAHRAMYVMLLTLPTVRLEASCSLLPADRDAASPLPSPLLHTQHAPHPILTRLLPPSRIARSHPSPPRQIPLRIPLLGVPTRIPPLGIPTRIPPRGRLCLRAPGHSAGFRRPRYALPSTHLKLRDDPSFDGLECSRIHSVPTLCLLAPSAVLLLLSHPGQPLRPPAGRDPPRFRLFRLHCRRR